MTAYRIFDEALPDWEGLREHCDGLDYTGVRNPSDGVVYPGISVDIPKDVTTFISWHLERFFNKPVTIRKQFFRITTEDLPTAPHQAHTDAIEGTYAFMVYMNRPEHCAGGTSILKHVTGWQGNPIDEMQQAQWERDTNRPDMWRIIDMCPMKSNRAFLVRAGVMHRAEPIGGFGKTAEDGRLVLITFFDIGEKDGASES